MFFGFPASFLAFTFASYCLTAFSIASYFYFALLAFHAKKFSFVTGVRSSAFNAARSSSIYSSIVFVSAPPFIASAFYAALSFFERITNPSGNLCMYWHLSVFGHSHLHPYLSSSMASRKCLHVIIVSIGSLTVPDLGSL
jgi:hypothetical protein